MPTRAIRPYAHDPAQRREKIDRERANDSVRKLYKTPAWIQTSKAVRARDPLCRIAKLCVQRKGSPAPSAVADHVIPARQFIAQNGGDPRFFFDMNNLQGSCKADHDAKTAVEAGFAKKAGGMGVVF